MCEWNNGTNWDDLVVYLSKDEALEVSQKNPCARVEIFKKSEKGGYKPTYNYYLNGELV